jgi:hypothetical protein
MLYDFDLLFRMLIGSIYLWLYSPLLGFGRFFSFFIFYTVSRTPLTGDQPIPRPLPAHRTTQTQTKRTQTLMPRVGFEPKIPVFERAKTVHAIDRATTVIGCLIDLCILNNFTVLEYSVYTKQNIVILLTKKTCVPIFQPYVDPV